MVIVLLLTYNTIISFKYKCISLFKLKYFNGHYKIL